MSLRIITLPLFVMFMVACRENVPQTSPTTEEVTANDEGTPKVTISPKATGVPKTFGIGERLEYTLVWNKVTVGKMKICVMPKVTVAEKTAWKFQLSAKTNSFADSIHKIRIDLKSYVDDARTCSLRYYSNSTEGSRSKIKNFEFDWDKMKVHYLKNRTEDRGWRELKAKSFDPLAMFFALREMPIDDDTGELSVWVSDGKKNIQSKATVVRREKIKTENGKRYDCYLVEPELKDLKGVFAKSKDAKLQIWVSNDSYRIPVKIASKVAIGSFTATLTKHVAHDK